MRNEQYQEKMTGSRRWYRNHGEGPNIVKKGIYTKVS